MITPGSPADTPNVWQRFMAWMQRWGEAMDFDMVTYQDERIARLEAEVALLRGVSRKSEEAPTTSTTSTLESINL